MKKDLALDKRKRHPGFDSLIDVNDFMYIGQAIKVLFPRSKLLKILNEILAPSDGARNRRMKTCW